MTPLVLLNNNLGSTLQRFDCDQMLTMDSNGLTDPNWVIRIDTLAKFQTSYTTQMYRFDTIIDHDNKY